MTPPTTVPAGPISATAPAFWLAARVPAGLPAASKTGTDVMPGVVLVTVGAVVPAAELTDSVPSVVPAGLTMTGVPVVWLTSTLPTRVPVGPTSWTVPAT